MIANPIGVGLRPTHYPYLRGEPRTNVGWFEAISENYVDTQGRPLQTLEFMRERFPVALHGVSLSIGLRPEAGKLEQFRAERSRYLTRLRALIERIDPFIVSDHLCWTGVPGGNIHDLLPVPFNDASLAWIAEQVDIVQNTLGRPLVLENVSSYLTYRSSTYSEWDFLVELLRRSGCKLLLDVNNVYVSAFNHGFSAERYLDAIPADAVAQIHLAGHTDMGTHLFDTHSRPVCDDVWKLFDRVIRRLPEVPVLIEWDDDIPEFPVLEEEVAKAAAIRDRYHCERAAAAPPREARVEAV